MIDKQIQDIVRKTSFRLRYVFVSGLLSALGAVLEAVSMIVLIPIVNTIIQSDISGGRSNFLITKLTEFVRMFSDSESVSLIIFSGVFVFLVILKSLLVYSAALVICYITRKFVNDIRNIVFESYLDQGKAFFDNTNSGKLYQVLMTQTHILGNELRTLGASTTNLLILAGYVVVLFYLHWKVTFVSLLMLPLLNYSVGWLIKKIKRTSRDQAAVQNELGEQISNTLSSIPLIKAYSNEEEERKRFRKINRVYLNYTFSIDKKNSLVLPLQEIVIVISVMILLTVMTTFFNAGGNSGAVGSMLIYFFVLKRASNLFGIFNELKAMLSRLSGPWEEILKMIDRKPEFLVNDGCIEFKGLEKGIRIDHLQFAYHSGNAVLKDVTAFIEKGKMTALVGETGSGKSTIANILMRYYACPTGSVFLDDRDLNDFTIKSIRKKIAIVNQDPALFNGTIKENLLYGIHEEIPDSRVIQTLELARLGDFVCRHSEGLDLQIGDRGVQLSGGERQRLAIARAMLKGADIFLLDEPTSALDSKTEELIQQALDEMTRGKTTIVIAHRLSTIKKADHVVVMQHGSVVESGNPEELRRKKGLFYQYLEAQKLL